MKAAVTVKENYEFRRIYHKGTSSVQPALVVYCQKNKNGMTRLGVTVSTKIGKAHIRNHVKRQFRELYHRNLKDMKHGYDLLIVARARVINTKYEVLNKQYRSALENLQLIAEVEQ